MVGVVEAVSLILKYEQVKVHKIKTVNIIIYNFGLSCFTCFCLCYSSSSDPFPFFTCLLTFLLTILYRIYGLLQEKANHKIHKISDFYILRMIYNT